MNLSDLEKMAEIAADPARALSNLHRWFDGDEAKATGLIERPWLMERLCLVMGAGQAVADSIIQNPELAEILADSGELSAPLDYDGLVNEGEGLLKSAISFTHQLDRIRYLKQRHLLRIVYQDLSGGWKPEQVWAALSVLADGVFELCVRSVWRDFATGEVPVGVIALGKHGGREINYSSDIDVLFVADDSLGDLSNATRLCEKLTRALSGHMGRGFLYRIDHRLRPMGKVGPIVQKVSATVGYYHAYAEPWEMMAQIRARHCAGNATVSESFLKQMEPEIYRGPRSEIFMDGILEAKMRYESEVRARGDWQSNLKLGGGGIRDIEFLVQVFQLLAGNRYPSLKGSSTLDALTELGNNGDLSERDVSLLSESYRFYRQVEHRIQLLHNLQSHSLPNSESEQIALARSMGIVSYEEVLSEIRLRQSQVRNLLVSRIPKLKEEKPQIEVIEVALGLKHGSTESELAERMILSSEEPEMILDALEDDGFAARMKTIVERAPRAAVEVAFYKQLWDIAFSEDPELAESEEEDVLTDIGSRIAMPDWEARLGSFLRRCWVVAALRHAHHRDSARTWRFLTKISDAVLIKSVDRVGGEGIDVVALGRLGSAEMLLCSDWDVMLIVEDKSDHLRAEKVGESWVKAIRRICSSSGHFAVDTRLRPEGRDGLVVRTASGLRAYSETSMETWERMAFTRARSLRQRAESVEAMRAAAYGTKWTSKNEADLTKVLGRIRTERVRVTEDSRDLKLGRGFLLEIEWLVGLLKLRNGGLEKATAGIVEGLNELNRMGLVNLNERDFLIQAYMFYSDLRNSLHLLEFDSDSVLPENPQRLLRIAKVMGFDNENELLLKIEEVHEGVMGVCQQLSGGVA